jgi:hypothetical protein
MTSTTVCFVQAQCNQHLLLPSAVGGVTLSATGHPRDSTLPLCWREERPQQKREALGGANTCLICVRSDSRPGTRGPYETTSYAQCCLLKRDSWMIRDLVYPKPRGCAA